MLQISVKNVEVIPLCKVSAHGLTCTDITVTLLGQMLDTSPLHVKL